MISNNFSSPAFRAQQVQQQVAFKGDSKDFNPGKATASLFIPGSGQLAKKEYTKAALLAGLFFGTTAGAAAIVKSSRAALPAGTSVAHPLLKLAFIFASPVIAMATAVYSGFDAFKPKATTEK